ncbi:MULTISPECIES: hypothetical protein [Clostridium]|uniref:Cyclic lactone autoinducer peptide n=1 Tax=Clostridium cibarium TaxID=2762247 RepID=A0ABR8PPL7_9CLOT|nr:MULTISPECIES: hypothetical protein [Clostridium]MBD7910108.1 hypothetical protein [Clostridium cibarium]
MSILKKVGNKVAEGMYDAAMSQFEKKADNIDCLFFVYYEPEFMQELIQEEE